MKKVKVIMDFNDLQENKRRTIGEEFNCSEERADFLSKHNAVEIVEEEKEIVEEEIKEEEIEEKPIFKKNKKHKK